MEQEAELLFSAPGQWDAEEGHYTLTSSALSFAPLLGITKRISISSISAINATQDSLQLRYRGRGAVRGAASDAPSALNTVVASTEDARALPRLVAALEELLAVQRGDVGAAAAAAPQGNAFFSVSKLLDGTQRIKYDTMGFTGFVEGSPSVSSPFAVGDYIVYAVRTEFTLYSPAQEEPATREMLVYHRYSQFEQLDQRLRALVDSNLDSLLVSLPTFPPKPWIPVGQFGAEWLKSRTRKLDAWLSKLCAVSVLLSRPEYLQPILDFLGQGELWEPEKDEGGAAHASSTSEVFSRIFEKGVYGVNSALGKLLDERDPPSAEEDYKYVRSVFEQQGLKPKKVPWSKFVVSLCGTTSSGKSSFVSHLFTVACVTSSGAGQVDTGFSIVETVPEEEFRRYAPDTVRDFPEFTDAELKANVGSSNNVYGDKRYGCVFVYLDSGATMHRYREQLDAQREELLEYDKIRTVLVNERYLNGTPERVEMARRLIIVDSKGVDATTLGGSSSTRPSEDSLSYMEREISTFQYFTKISALTLFFIPAADVRNCEPAITVFELSLVCSKDGLGFLKSEIKKRRSKAAAEAPTGIDPLSGIVGRLLGVDQIYGMARWVGQKVSNVLLLDKGNRDIEHGNARWEKTFFILSKADEVFNSADRAENAESQIYYELGLAMGRRLHYLEPPTHSKCFMIGLPEKQAQQQEAYVGALPSFMAYISKQSNGARYDRSRDDSIVSMCDNLERAMAAGWVAATWYSTVLPYIRAAKRRAMDRRFSM